MSGITPECVGAKYILYILFFPDITVITAILTLHMTR